MAACEQTIGMNMLQHGHMVHDAYIALWEELNAATLYGEPELTRWFEVCGATENLPLAPEALRSYHVYHDCGKHLVLCTDKQGRRHFPDHARASASQYRAIFAQDERTQYLIAHDMDFHTRFVKPGTDPGPRRCTLPRGPKFVPTQACLEGCHRRVTKSSALD